MFGFVGDVGYLIILLGLGGLAISGGNLLVLALLCEVVWVGFYYTLAFASATFDSLLLVFYSIYLLCVATCETGVGLNLLLVKFRIDGNLRSVGVNHRGGKHQVGNYRGFWGKAS
jgi:NADH:ubiquinone oxidoreductase subunit K